MPTVAPAPNPSMCVTGPNGVVMTFSWDDRLVILSVAIAIVGSFAALECAGRMREKSTGQSRRRFTILGAALMGLAIWSMHFVGMLALKMPMKVGYATGWSMLSMVAAAVGSAIAFAIMNQPRISRFNLMAGSVAMGLAIVSMHYVGMKSMEMAAAVDYEPLRFTASVAIAIAASAGALALGYSIPRNPRWAYVFKAGSAVIMGIAIAGMHYTGMTAARYRAASVTAEALADPMVGPMPLRDLLVIAALVFGIALIALAARAAIERQRALQAYQSLATELEQRVQSRTAELESMNRDLSAFSYTVSHDLRSPLRTIMGFCDIIEEAHGGELGPDVRSHFERIRKATHRMDALLTGLLNMANITRATLDRRDVDLSQLARGILSDLAAQEPERNVTIQVEDGLHASADATLLTSVLQNLLHNGWKFSAQANPARISFGKDNQNGRIVFFVRDNGAGFDMAHSAKLFGMFERLHHSGQFAGHGIGLAMTKRIVERHGGKIWAESTPGAGATFWFTLG